MWGINTVGLFIITMSAGLLAIISKTFYSRMNGAGTKAYFVYNGIVSALCTVLFFAFSGFKFEASLYTVLLALAFGAVTLVQIISNLSALACGPLGYTTLLISLSCVIPALSGPVFWPETDKFDPLNHISGLVLVVICCILSMNKSKGGEEKKASMRWFVLCMIAALATGGIGLLQRVHQTSAHSEEIGAFLMCSFAFSAICSFVALLFLKSKKDSTDKTQMNEKSSAKSIVVLVIIFVACALGTALNNQINLYLSGVVETIIFFPIVNIGGLVLSLLTSFIVFKEKLTLRQWIGVVVGVAAGYFLAVGI